MLEKAAREIFGNDISCKSIPVADGGEGTTDAVIAARSGKKITLRVHGPLMESAEAYYGDLGNGEAVMEMAVASGLPMIPAEKRNPLNTTTYGTGEMLRDALDKGFSKISIAIGGSATNDGGIGCMRALGVRFLDCNGNELSGICSMLPTVVDTINLEEALSHAKEAYYDGALRLFRFIKTGMEIKSRKEPN